MKHLMLLLSMVLLNGIMTGCKSDGDGLKGVYGNLGSDGYGYAFYFVNDNTVEWYSCHEGEVGGHGGYLAYDKRIGNSRLYYPSSEGYRTYTYTKADNKIYIPQQGKILTIDGDILIQDGGGIFRKY